MGHSDTSKTHTHYDITMILLIPPHYVPKKTYEWILAWITLICKIVAFKQICKSYILEEDQLSIWFEPTNTIIIKMARAPFSISPVASSIIRGNI